jgi:hypothetical protein
VNSRRLVVLAASLVFVPTFVAISDGCTGQGADGDSPGKKAAAIQETTGLESTSWTASASEGGAMPEGARPDRCFVRLAELKPEWCDKVPQAPQDHLR